MVVNDRCQSLVFAIVNVRLRVKFVANKLRILFPISSKYNGSQNANGQWGSNKLQFNPAGDKEDSLL